MRPWIVLLLAAGAAAAPSYQPTAEELSRMRARLDELRQRIEHLGLLAEAPLRADIEIYRKAAEWILRYPEEFYTQAYVGNTLRALEHGIARAEELQRGEASWPQQKGRLVRGYRSAVDGSVQPYALAIPDSYDRRRAIRLDVVLHGRGATLNEVSFIAAHESSTPVPAAQDFIQLEVFGRGNNAYRWAGEADVFEALDSVCERYNIDRARVVLRGFSMGGAGAWQIGLHHPLRWAAMEAGAGFTETRHYARLKDIPPYQAATLHIYDAVDYAPNAADLAVVGYGGEVDPQLQASVNIREALAREGFHFRHEGLSWFGIDLRAIFLVGPNTPHRFHPESKKTSEEFIRRAVERAGYERPEHFRFVTWTPRYNGSSWASVEALEHQYERAEIECTRAPGRTTIRTSNVFRLELEAPGEVVLDGKLFPSGTMRVEKHRGSWRQGYGQSLLRKVHGLQGPIDDAFLDAFVCVRPTGKPLSAAASDYARRALEAFQSDFARYFRGDVPVKDDRAVTDADVAGRNLILFGDPGSNSWIARMLPRLPLRWTAETVTLAGRKFAAADSVPVLIYPNPLNPARYVAINSGHTFHEADLRGTNALLYPRLGDYAVLRASDGAVELAGLFDEEWQVP